ncbi:MAG: hypothetical protein HY320_14885 [Armatimonadetes bacterium]|nr:hypothetical protein [Armatimonadota bacterium]
MRGRFMRAIALGAVCAALGWGGAHAGPFDGVLGKGVKVLGIGFAVKHFGPQINKAINTLLGQKGVRYEGVTKVVPIVSIGNGAFVGAAQVQGEGSLVKGVKGVVQLEVPMGRVRGKALIPVNSLTPGRGYKRVRGTGVTAVIDFRI